jgi:hypothetical protein
LKGYVNIDCTGYRANEFKVKESNLMHYYKDKEIGKPSRIYVDMIMDLRKDNFDIYEGKVDEMVMVNGIEHFNPQDAINLLANIKKSLIPGGKLLIDFPDFEAMARAFIAETPADELMRLIYGSDRNPHKWGYTRKSFKEFLGKGWQSITWKGIVKHDYPSHGCIAVKE